MAAIRETLEGILQQHGLWPDEAKAVVAGMEARDAAGDKSMVGRWDEDASGYPAPLIAVLSVTARQAAVEWIDANKPEHFARGLLTA